MRFALLLLILINTLNLFAQDHCKYNKPKKHRFMNPEFNSEYAGVFLNGFNVSQNQFQLEANSLLGAFNNKYNQAVYAGAFLVRYGLTDFVEAQFRAYKINPPEVNTDTLLSRYLSLGVKVRLLHLERNAVKWHFGFTATSFIMDSLLFQEFNDFQIGADITLNSSFVFYKRFHFDLSGGIAAYEFGTNAYGKLSSKLMFKPEYAKVGIYIGIVGNHYYESMINYGILITNNKNYLLTLSLSSTDKALSPSVSFTYNFNN